MINETKTTDLEATKQKNADRQTQRSDWENFKLGRYTINHRKMYEVKLYFYGGSTAGSTVIFRTIIKGWDLKDLWNEYLVNKKDSFGLPYHLLIVEVKIKIEETIALGVN